MIAGKGSPDLIVATQFLCAAGVFGCDDGYLFENSNGPKRHVFQIANWRADNVEGAAHEDDLVKAMGIVCAPGMVLSESKIV